MKNRKPHPEEPTYSQAFKLQVVREYEQRFRTKDDIMNKYHISGHSTVLQWCRKYGKLYYSNTKVPGRPMKDSQKQRIKELEHELKEARSDGETCSE